MSLIATILIGLIAGAVAKLVMPGKDPGGLIVTTLLGIGGAVIATYLGKLIGLYEPGESAGFIGAIVGAIVILWIYRVIQKKKTSTTA